MISNFAPLFGSSTDNVSVVSVSGVSTPVRLKGEVFNKKQKKEREKERRERERERERELSAPAWEADEMRDLR